MYVWCVSVVPTAAPSFTLSGPVPVVSGLLPGIGPEQFNPLQFSTAFAIGSGLSQTPTFRVVAPVTPNSIIAQVFATNGPILSYGITTGNSSGSFLLGSDALLRATGDFSPDFGTEFANTVQPGIYVLTITATNIYGTGSAIFTIIVAAGVPSYLTLPWERPRMPRGFSTHLQPHQPHVPPATPNITSAIVTVSLPVTSDELILATTITNTPLTVGANNILTPGIISVNGVPGNSPYYFEIYGTKNLRTANASLGGLIPPPGVYNLKIQPANAMGRGNIGNLQVTVPVGAVPVITNNSANFTDTPPPVAGTVINTMSATQNPTSWAITAGDPNGNFQIANVNSAAGTCDIQITAAGVTNTNSQNTTQILTMRATNASGQSAPGTDTISYQPASTGWTVLTQAAGSNTWYVSSSDPNRADNASTNGTQARPFATIAFGAAQLRTGHSDWLLLKKGDVWTNDFTGVFAAKSGLSSSQPILFGAYGAGARPMIRISSAWGQADVYRPTGDFTALVGLEFYAYTRDPNNASFSAADANAGLEGVNYLNPFTWHLIEDCKFSYFDGNVVCEPQNAPWGQQFVMRRCVVTDSYNNGSHHNQGLFADDYFNFLCEENFWDHNGWADFRTTASITIASPATITWNAGSSPFPLINGNTVVFTTTGALPTGLSANTVYTVSNVNAGAKTFNLVGVNTSGSQSGTHTVIWHDPISDCTHNRNCYISDDANGPQGATCTYRRNITCNSASEGVQNRPGGLTWDNLVLRCTYGITVGDGNPADGVYPAGISSVQVQNNVILHSVDLPSVPPDPRGEGIHFSGCHTSNCFASNNIIAHNLSSQIDPFGVEIEPSCTGVVVTNNIVYDWGGTAGVTVNAGATGITISPNQVNLSFNPAVNDGRTESAALGGGTPSGPYTSPARDIASYSASIGGAGTVADFIAKCRAQSRDTYDTRYTANAINNYIRAGFNQSAVPATP